MFVRLWMTANPVTVSPEQTVTAVLQCLREHNFRRVPVVDAGNRLVGIVSKQDIFNAMPSSVDGSSAGSSRFLADTTKVEEIMTFRPMWVETLTPMEDVARQMLRNKMGGMPVLEEGRLVGIVTESDIFRAFLEMLGPEDEGVRVELIISKNSRDLYEVLDIFKRYDIFIRAVGIHHNFSDNQRLLTVRLLGEEIEPMLERLRSQGVQINSIRDNDDLL